MWPFDRESKELVGRGQAAFNHATIYQQIHGGPGPTGLSVMAGAWQSDVAQHLANARDITTNALKQAGGSWQGDAAQAFQSGVSPMSNWADEAHQASTTISGMLEDQANHFALVRNTMPPPVQVTSVNFATTTNMFDLTAQMQDSEKQETAATAASDQARQIYDTYTGNTNDTSSGASNQYSQPPTQVSLGPGTVSPQAAAPVSLHGSSVHTHAPAANTAQSNSAAIGSQASVASVAPSTNRAGNAPAVSDTTAQQSAAGGSTATAPATSRPEPVGMTPVNGPAGGSNVGVVGGMPGLGGGTLGDELPPEASGSNIAARMAGGEPLAGGEPGVGARPTGGVTEPEPGDGGRSGAGGAAAAAEEGIEERLTGQSAAGNRSAMAGGPMGGGGKKEEDAEHRTKYVQPSADHFGEGELPPTAPPTLGTEDQF